METKIDPKITAAKVYPIDQVREALDEEIYDGGTDPQMEPMSFYEHVIGLCCAGIAFSIVAVCVFH